MKQHNKLRKS